MVWESFWIFGRERSEGRRSFLFFWVAEGSGWVKRASGLSVVKCDLGWVG